MKKILLSCSAVALTATAASAGSYAPAPAEPVVVQPVIVEVVPAPWQGGYVGATLSWGEATAKEDSTGEEVKPEGTTGAIRGGYDWQSNQIVYGLGAEYVFGDYKKDVTGGSVKVEDTTTLFGRVGYSATPDFLVYGLVGYTWSKATAPGTDKMDMDGMAYGVGAEYRFADNWSGLLEYTYNDFGTLSDTDVKVDMNQIKLGVNYRF